MQSPRPVTTLLSCGTLSARLPARRHNPRSNFYTPSSLALQTSAMPPTRASGAGQGEGNPLLRGLPGVPGSWSAARGCRPHRHVGTCPVSGANLWLGTGRCLPQRGLAEAAGQLARVPQGLPSRDGSLGCKREWKTHKNRFLFFFFFFFLFSF